MNPTVDVFITNSLGNVVHKKRVPAINKAVIEVICLDQFLSPGIYYITVFDSSVKHSNKFLIQ
jgi:hypothetical protein